MTSNVSPEGLLETQTADIHRPHLWKWWCLWWSVFGIALCLTFGVWGLYLWAPEAFPPDVLQRELTLPVVIIRTLRFACCAGFALVLFVSHSRSRTILLFSSAFPALGAIGMSVAFLGANSPEPLSLLFFGKLLASTNLLVALTFPLISSILFPNGRFVPSWTRFLLPVFLALVLGFVVAVWLGPKFPTDWFIVYILTAVLCQSFQSYRYRLTANYTERQQIKWVLLGFVWGLLIQAIAILAIVQGEQPVRGWYFVLLHVGVLTSYVVILCGFSLALIRYRLWDVDIVINRTLVFGLLAVSLGLLFVGGFFGLQWGFQEIFGGGQESIAAVLATGIVVGAFQPSFRWLRRFVDRKIYGIAYDYTAHQAQLKHPREPILQDHRTEELVYKDYVKVSSLGAGGMGDVLLAKKREAETFVAIKILPQGEKGESESYQKRFAREAETLARLEHPKIISLVEYGHEEDHSFMVMEYIKGDGLDVLVSKHKKLPLPAVISLLKELAGAVDYAHENGIIHRDLKPSNIMLEYKKDRTEATLASPLEKYQRAVLMDFGIARVLSAQTQLTRDDSVIGTPQYIAPEQIQGPKNIDGKADVYSLGVMAFYLLTGRLPFDATNFFSMLMAHLSQPPPDPRRIEPTLPVHAAQAILRAMSKAPRDRFATATAFVQAMEGKDV